MRASKVSRESLSLSGEPETIKLKRSLNGLTTVTNVVNLSLSSFIVLSFAELEENPHQIPTSVLCASL